VKNEAEDLSQLAIQDRKVVSVQGPARQSSLV